MTLQVGDGAPAITARNQNGDGVTFSFEAPTVVYFYPRDDTPGCTTEACQFDAELDTYHEAGVSVYGVPTDTVASHAAFADKHDLGFDLLADPHGEIAAAFGVDARDGTAPRTTFVLADGEVKVVYTTVRADGHARTVLGDMLDAGLVHLEF